DQSPPPPFFVSRPTTWGRSPPTLNRNNMTTAPLVAARHTHASQKLRLWVTNDDLVTLNQLRDQIGAITGAQPRNAILLRAGLSALTQAVEKTAKDVSSDPDGKPRSKLELLLWLTQAAAKHPTT